MAEKIGRKGIPKTARSRKTTRGGNKAVAKGRTVKKKKAWKRKRGQHFLRGRASEGTLVAYEQRGLGPRSGGQAGDTQGLSAAPDVDSESVEELMEEGQSFEAEVLNGIENAADPDESEVYTHEVAEDDVPGEYFEKR